MSARELKVKGNAQIKGLMKRFYENDPQGKMADRLGYVKVDAKQPEESNFLMVWIRSTLHREEQ